MAQTEANLLSQIPEMLRAQFARLERRLWWVDTLMAVSGLSGSLAISYLVLFASDRVWTTPVWMRSLLVFGGFAGSVYFLWGWARDWVIERRDARILAGLVQRHYRRLGDRLLGIVELADANTRPAHVSPELCRAAIRQVAMEAAQFDFGRAVPARRARISVWGAVMLAAVLSILWWAVPDAAFNAFARWLWPAAPVARYTFVSVDDIPDPLRVAHGEPFELVVGVSGHGWRRPSAAYFQVDAQGWEEVGVSGGRAVFSVPALTREASLRLKVGDVQERITILPLVRPALRYVKVAVRYPDYLGYPDTEIDVSRGAYSYLEGSQLGFRGETTRVLTNASFQWLEPAGAPVAPRISGAEFSIESAPMEGKGRVAFTWRDLWGLTCSAPWQLALQPHADVAPEVACPGQAAAVAILEEEVLNIRAEAKDDYGLSQLSMVFEARKRQETNLVAAGELPIAQGDAQRVALEGGISFSPLLLKLPAGSVVTLHAQARDYFPGRPPSTSDPIRVYVLGKEEHARLVHQELERIMAELEDVTRRQESLRELGQALKGAGSEAESGRTEEVGRQLAQQAQEQEALATKLEQLSGKVAATIKEALRNSSIPAALLEDWAQHAQTMQSVAQTEMAQAAQSLARAQEATSPRTQAIEEALAMEEEALRKLLELQRRIGPSLDRMLSNTLAQRLRLLARNEAQIGKALQSLLPQVIGMLPDQMPALQRLTTEGIGGDQGRARREAQQLHEEISRFYGRTSEPHYGSVTTGMKESKMADKLEALAGLIHGNMGALAMGKAREWETQFLAWAEELDQAKATSQGEDGGGDGGSISEEALRRLLALLRTRQQEMGLRQLTELLDKERETSRDYRIDSVLLSVQQGLLVRDVRDLKAGGGGRFLSQAGDAMRLSERLLAQPRTDVEVVAAETDAINLLEAEIMDMMKRSQGSSAASSMAMLMRMMGLGGSGGGSFVGGSTENPPQAVEGDVTGPGGEERKVEKSVGRSSQVVPAEFREAMQHYFRGLESLESKLPTAP